MKYKINKCDNNGNVITGYEEILKGTKQECERDYRNYHEYDGPLDILEQEDKDSSIFEIEDKLYLDTVLNGHSEIVKYLKSLK